MNLHDNMKELVSLFESDGIVNQTDIMTDLGPEKSTYLRVDTPYIAYKIARNYVIVEYQRIINLYMYLIIKLYLTLLHY